MTTTDSAILRNLQIVYASYKLEEVSLFRVADKVLYQFQQGDIRDRVIVGGLWKSADYPSDNQRHSLYNLAFGAAARPGSFCFELENLWCPLIRCVLGKAVASGPNDLQKAAVPLASWLASSGAKLSYQDVPRLETSLGKAGVFLANGEVLKKYRAQDLWGVVDLIARTEFGVVPNITRQRTAAAAGAAILGWLADQAATSNGFSNATMPVFLPESLRTLLQIGSLQLQNACQLWQSANGSC